MFCAFVKAVKKFTTDQVGMDELIAIKKLIRSSDELLHIRRCSSWNLTYLSRHTRDGIGTFLRFTEVGCQGFIGPLPSAFLDK